MHRVILSLAALLVIIGVVLGYFFAVAKRLPTSIQDLSSTLLCSVVTIPQDLEFTKELTSKIPQAQNVDLSNLDTTGQLKTLGERAGEISQHTQKVLGASIQKNEKDATPIHESALEYGKYIYCKQVVSTYESAEKAASSEEPSKTTDN